MRHSHFCCHPGRFILLAITALIFAQSIYAQVTVAPSMLFVDSRSGIGNLYITNNSATPQEVSIGFAFGYPDADSVGNAVMNYSDTVAAKTYSLNPMVHAFPRSFLLSPNQQQTVRLQVRSRNDAKDAFYFTRVKVSSNQKSPEVGRKLTDSISAQIAFKFDQIFPVFYRKGNVTTGLVVNNATATQKDKKLTVLADVERTGTAPYIGSVKAELFSTANASVAFSEATASVFFKLKDKIDIDVSKVPAGTYRLVLTFETKRSDVSTDDLLQAPPVSKEFSVALQ